LANFNDTLLYLRGNTFIDYEQLGLKFRLYSCEVLFNRGLCYIYLQQDAAGMQDLDYAVKEKMTPDHEVINEAIQAGAVVSFHKPACVAQTAWLTPCASRRVTPSFPSLSAWSIVRTKPKLRT
jgi:hypothetical protein